MMRPGIDQNMSCTLGDCLASRSEGCSQPIRSCGSQFIHVHFDHGDHEDSQNRLDAQAIEFSTMDIGTQKYTSIKKM